MFKDGDGRMIEGDFDHMVVDRLLYIPDTPKGILPPLHDPSVLNGNQLLKAVLDYAEAHPELTEQPSLTETQESKVYQKLKK